MNGQTYTWDNNGNLRDDGVNQYQYDAANRLKAFGPSGQPPTSTYAYSGLGDRLSQTVDSVTTNYVLDLNAGLTQVLADGTNTYLYGNGRVGELQPTGFAYHLGDALGSVRQLANSTGTVTLARSYEPYGNTLTTNSSGTSNTVWQFTDEQRDSTGLQFNRARYYASSLGRFITHDSWRGKRTYPMSYNRWLYAYADPVNLVDPSGLYSQTEIKQIFGVATYQEMLDLFEKGSMRGQWGFLEVLHRAKNGDGLEMYTFEPMCVSEETPNYTNSPVIQQEVFRTTNGLSQYVHASVKGSLLLTGGKLILVGSNGIGRYALPHAAESDYFVLNNYSHPLSTWASTKYSSLRLIQDKVDWIQFKKDLAELIGVGLILSLPICPECAVGGGVIEVSVIVTDALEASQPTIIELARGKDPNPANLAKLLQVPLEAIAEETIAHAEDVATLLVVYSMLSNIRNGVAISP